MRASRLPDLTSPPIYYAQEVCAQVRPNYRFEAALNFFGVNMFRCILICAVISFRISIAEGYAHE